MINLRQIEHVLLSETAGRIKVMPLKRGTSQNRRVIALACAIAAIALSGCANPPHGPYQFRDYSDTMRMGGDFIDMVVYKPGTKR